MSKLMASTSSWRYDRLRPLSYPDSHIVLICFAVDSPDFLDNVQEKVGNLDLLAPDLDPDGMYGFAMNF